MNEPRTVSAEPLSRSREVGVISRTDMLFYRDLLQNHSRIMSLRVEAAAHRRDPGLLFIAHRDLECSSGGAGPVHESIFFSYILKETAGPRNDKLEQAIRRLASAYHQLIHPGRGLRPLDPHQAILTLLKSNKECLGADKDALRLLLKAFSPFPPGSMVALSDGRSARVIEAHQDFAQRPTVEILDTPAHHEIEDLRRSPYSQIRTLPRARPPRRFVSRQDEASLSSAFGQPEEEERCPSCLGGPVRFSRSPLRHWLRKARASSKRCCLQCGHHWNEPKLYAPGPLSLPTHVAAAMGSLLALVLASVLYLNLLAWAKTALPPPENPAPSSLIRLFLQSP